METSTLPDDNILVPFFLCSTPKAPLFMVQKVTREKFTTYRPDLWERRQNASKANSHARHGKKTPVSEIEKR